MMITTPLQIQSFLQNQNVSLSLCYSDTLALKQRQRVNLFYTDDSGIGGRGGGRVSVTCSISKIHNYGTLDYERRPNDRWNAIYKRIALMKNPELGSASVLNQWENEGRNLTKWELCRVVKELRKYRKPDRALQVYDWINNRPERFRISASDVAIQLDLIARVHGVSSAEGFFLNLTNNLKDKRTYGALLNAYVHSRSREKAESLLEVMRSKRYLITSLSFSTMMTLYKKLKDYDKVDMIVSEMKEKNIQLDIYTYNIWLYSCVSQGSIEKMEQVFGQMSKDPTIIPNWITFSTMAAMYIKMELFEKAQECLKKSEGRILGRDKVPFHYLLSLYGSVGNKDEVYRVWNNYKSMFPSMPNLGYHAVISSLLRMDDIEGAEKLYEEWVSVRPYDDSRIGNLLIRWYLKKGKSDKVFSFFEHMTEGGGCPNSTTWMLLSDGHIAEKRVSEALLCLEKALITCDSKSWKPKPIKLAAFLKLCQDENDMESAEVLIELLRKSGYHNDDAYAALISKDEPSNRIERIDDVMGPVYLRRYVLEAAPEEESAEVSEEAAVDTLEGALEGEPAESLPMNSIITTQLQQTDMKIQAVSDRSHLTGEDRLARLEEREEQMMSDIASLKESQERLDKTMETLIAAQTKVKAASETNDNVKRLIQMLAAK